MRLHIQKRITDYICFMRIKKRDEGIQRVGQRVNYDNSRSSIEVSSPSRQVLDRMYNDAAAKAGVLGKLESKLTKDGDQYTRRLVDRSYAEYEEGGVVSAPQQQQMDQEGLMQMKQMHEEAAQKGDMEKVGQIEMMIKEVYENSDERTKEMIDELFPELSYMSDEVEREEQPSQSAMMKKGGVLYKF